MNALKNSILIVGIMLVVFSAPVYAEKMGNADVDNFVADFITGGIVKGESFITLDTDAAIVLTAADCKNALRINNNDAVKDYTLPGAALGETVCFYSLYARVVTIDPVDGTDTIYLNGSSVGAGDAIDSAGGVGNLICLMAIDNTRWITLGQIGVWVDGGAD